MNILIIPSWCPTPRRPLAGTFFVEQSDAMATLHPDWNIFFLSWDSDAAKLLTRHPHWLVENMQQFCKHLFSDGICCTKRSSGLNLLEVWTPVFRTNTFQHKIRCLKKHAAKALAYLENVNMFPDIIHAHASIPAGKVACDIFQQRGIPYIITEHMSSCSWSNMRLWDDSPIPEIQEAFAHAQKTIAVSSSLAKCLGRLDLGGDIAVIPNGVNSEKFFLAPQRATSATATNFLSIGWPSLGKGTDILLKAFAQLHVGYPETSLQIIGDSHERPKFERLAISLGIQQAVIWHGNIPRSSLPGILAMCDIFVLPSRYETFGVAYVEALMCGKPIIATACGGPEDIVTPQNGILIPVNDVQALFRAMQECITKTFSAEEIRSDAIKRFSMLRITEILSNIYKECVV